VFCLSNKLCGCLSKFRTKLPILIELCHNIVKLICICFSPLKPSGNYVSQLSSQSVTVYFVFRGFSLETAIISLHSINQMIFVMVECCVHSEARVEFLNTILTSFNLKGLIPSHITPRNM
jgi:hypothetical protein